MVVLVVRVLVTVIEILHVVVVEGLGGVVFVFGTLRDLVFLVEILVAVFLVLVAVVGLLRLDDGRDDGGLGELGEDVVVVGVVAVVSFDALEDIAGLGSLVPADGFLVVCGNEVDGSLRGVLGVGPVSAIRLD